MKLQSAKVRVPGSTSNLGPCFDLCGLAIRLYAEVAFEPGGRGFQFDVRGEGAETIRQLESNLVLRAAEAVWKQAGVSPENMRIAIDNSIPLFSGLGSSGAAVAAGLMAANACCGSPLSMEDLLTLGTELEGHPDNVAASLLGGLALSSNVNGRILSLSYRSPQPLTFAVLLPQLQISTQESRKKLPSHYPAGEAVFNVSRAAQLAAAFATGRLNEVRFAFEDRMHQPYRAKQVPYLYDAIQAAEEAGAWGAFLSGSGPSVGALCAPEQSLPVVKAFREVQDRHRIPGKAFSVEIDNQGAILL
jgi:homoserine kinase